MTNRQRPGYLRPVPTAGEAAAKLPDPAHEHVESGITPPTRRGHSGVFVTDVIVELG